MQRFQVYIDFFLFDQDGEETYLIGGEQSKSSEEQDELLP